MSPCSHAECHWYQLANSTQMTLRMKCETHSQSQQEHSELCTSQNHYVSMNIGNEIKTSMQGLTHRRTLHLELSFSKI